MYAYYLNQIFCTKFLNSAIFNFIKIIILITKAYHDNHDKKSGHHKTTVYRAYLTQYVRPLDTGGMSSKASTCLRLIFQYTRSVGGKYPALESSHYETAYRYAILHMRFGRKV